MSFVPKVLVSSGITREGVMEGIELDLEFANFEESLGLIDVFKRSGHLFLAKWSDWRFLPFLQNLITGGSSSRH